MKPRRFLRRLLVLLPLALVLAAPLAGADKSTDRRSSVALAGDLNDDGCSDLAVAERGRGAIAFLTAGPEPTLDRIWIFSGKDGELLRTLRPPAECPAFGRALENVGDVNGDGKPELAVSGGGPLWVFSGADGSVLFELAGELLGPGFGRSLAGGEDVDGDGAPDIVVYRAPCGKPVLKVPLLLIYSGRSGELIRVLGCAPESPLSEWAEAGIYGTLPGIAILDAVGLVPDRNDDGKAELVVCLGLGEPKWPRGCSEFALEVLDPVRGTSLRRSKPPEDSLDADPWVVRNLGDADGDGVDDVLLSIIDNHVILYSGATGNELRRHSFLGGYLHADGSSLDVIGDLDGDGVPEYLIGANEEIDTDPGFSHLHSGATGEILQSFHLGLLRDASGLLLRTEAGSEKGVGIDTCALGDTNGDGKPDVAVHMPAMEEARILSGADYSTLVTISLTPLLKHNEE